MAKDEEWYKKKQVAELLDFPPSLVQYYTDRKILEPEIKGSTGRGSARKYSKRNLLQLLLIKTLVDNGFSLADAKSILQGLDAWVKNIPQVVQQIPENFTDAEKLRLEEKAKVAAMLWEIESWDFRYNLFLTNIRQQQQRFNDGVKFSSGFKNIM